MDEIEWLDAHDQAALVASGEATARELVEAAIGRIERVNPQLNALAGTDFDGAIQRATQSKATGPLAGVPFLIKDVIAYPGIRWSFGCRMFAGQTPTEGSPYTDALDAAGLVTLGKTTMSEFGLLGSTECLAEGVTRNPWDLTRSALGSSGGSAVAVASGMVPVAHATDGGGSIRLPASAAGVFGFKPSRGRTLRTGPDAGALTQVISEHCVSRSVRDSARLFALTEQRRVPGQSAVDYVDGPNAQRLRIGVYRRTTGGDAPDAEVALALEATQRLCAELGHDVFEIDPPDVRAADVGTTFFTFAGSAMSQVVAMLTPMLGRPPGPDEFEPFTLSLLEWFANQDDQPVERAERLMKSISTRMAEHLAEVDVTLCPTLPFVPPPLGTISPDQDFESAMPMTERLAGYTAAHNLAGAPAMSVPLHMSADGLPIGMQFAASPGQDRTLFELAYELERAAPWRDRRPPGI